MQFHVHIMETYFPYEPMTKVEKSRKRQWPANFKVKVFILCFFQWKGSLLRVKLHRWNNITPFGKVIPVKLYRCSQLSWVLHTFYDYVVCTAYYAACHMHHFRRFYFGSTVVDHWCRATKIKLKKKRTSFSMISFNKGEYGKHRFFHRGINNWKMVQVGLCRTAVTSWYRDGEDKTRTRSSPSCGGQTSRLF